MAPETANAVQNIIAGTAVQHAVIQPPQIQSEPWERELVEHAAARLVESLPYKTPPEIVGELLKRLGEERQARLLQNHNHWPDYAPKFLKKLVRSLGNEEAWRRRKIEAFFKSDYRNALEVAGVFLSSPEEIEDAVSAAFEWLMAGRTEIAYFYRTLRNICVDRFREISGKNNLTFSETQGDEGDGWGEDGYPINLTANVSTPMGTAHNQDPLAIVMDRRNRVAKPLMVGRAKKSPKMRRVRRAKWTEALETARPNSAPQTNN